LTYHLWLDTSTTMFTKYPAETAPPATRASTLERFAIEVRSVGVTLARTARLVVAGGAALDLSSPEQAEFVRLNLHTVSRQHLRRGEDLAALVERITAMLHASTRRSRAAAKLDASLHLVRAIAMGELLQRAAGSETADRMYAADVAEGAVDCLAKAYAARLGTELPEEVERLFPRFAAALARIPRPGRGELSTAGRGEASRGRSARGAVSPLLLRQISLFRYVADAPLEALAAAMTRLKVPRGTAVVNAGEAADRLYLVIGGRFKVALNGDHGREIILGMLSPGEVFGEMSMIDDAPRSATVTALEPGELLALDRAVFRRCLESNFDLCLGVMRCLVDRVRHANQQIGGLAMLDVRGRVARTLHDIAVDRYGRRVVERVSGQDLARMVGASREMVSRVLKEFEANGALERVGGNLVLLEPLVGNAVGSTAQARAASARRTRR
jgi:CRP/FNR family cyclic AMP-dependent transcriptional regulator